jgi:signal transduction histidine kinase
MQAVDEIDETIREIRSSIFALEAHQHTGLRSEIFELVEEVADRAGLQSTVSFDGAIDAGVDADLAADVLAVLREALSNVARHADASGVEVRVSVDGGIELSVRDDGDGIPAEPARRSGLANLARRAEGHGGELVVGAEPGGGTLLRWSVPASLDD